MLRQTQALFIATLTLNFLASPVQAREEGGFRDGMRQAWDGIENAGRATGRHVSDAVDRLEDDFDRRPPFLFSKYLTLLQRDDKVMVILCEARVKGIYKKRRDRCEKIHNGAFVINELRGCATAVRGDLRYVGREMNRNLAELRASRDHYEHFRLQDDAEAYEEYMFQCAKHLEAQRKPPVARPTPKPTVKPVQKPEDKPAAPDVKPEDKAPAADEDLPPIAPVEGVRAL